LLARQAEQIVRSLFISAKYDTGLNLKGVL